MLVRNDFVLAEPKPTGFLGAQYVQRLCISSVSRQYFSQQALQAELPVV